MQFSQLEFHGYDPEGCLLEWAPRAGEILLHLQDLETIIDEYGEEIALVLIGGVNYYTGQYFDLKMAEMGHAKVESTTWLMVLEHPARFAQPGVDFAAWCTYKYLNAGLVIWAVFLPRTLCQ